MNLSQALLRAEAYPHLTHALSHIETHISQVFLTGEFAYKVKKPMDFGFLDFSTLEQRHHFCLEEVRLNRRFAPALYLDVVDIRQLPDGSVRVGAKEGEIIEYAVRMRQFAQQQVAAHLAAEDRLSDSIMRTLGARIAHIHNTIPASDRDDIARAGLPTLWRDAMVQNFQQIRPYLRDGADLARLNELEDWSHASWKTLEPRLWDRYHHGWVRECHGDLHLGNIVVDDGEPIAFDCIEFNPAIRWIDVMNEFAFLRMDCDSRGCSAQGFAALDEALSVSGDYGGLVLLTAFSVYRAMVRAKVSLLASPLPPGPDDDRLIAWRHYSTLALSYLQPRRPFMVLMCGVSGSGKSSLAASLAPQCGAIRLRSDVERKRLFGLAPDARTNEAGMPDIYTPEASQRTIDCLTESAAQVLEAGLPVVVDATFIHRHWRARFRELARVSGVACVVVVCRADETVLRERLRAREQRRDDPSEAGIDVMLAQLASAQWPVNESAVIEVDTTSPDQLAGVKARLLAAVESANSANAQG